MATQPDAESASDDEDWCISLDADGRLCTPATAELDYSFGVYPAFLQRDEIDVEALTPSEGSSR